MAKVVNAWLDAAEAVKAYPTVTLCALVACAVLPWWVAVPALAAGAAFVVYHA